MPVLCWSGRGGAGCCRAFSVSRDGEAVRKLGEDKNRLARYASTLDALSPLKVLGRGYAIPRGAGGIVKSTKDVSPGEDLELQVSDGTIQCRVKE